MNRTGAVLLALIVVVSVAAPALGAADPPSTSTAGTTGWHQTGTQTTVTTAETNETATATDAEPSPGARFGGVVAAQGVAVGSEIESRSLAYRLNRSETNASRADVIARQVNRSQSRLDALRAERQRLAAARENGTITEDEYRVRATQLSARINAIRRLNDQTSAAAATVPAETLRRSGVDVTALRSLGAMAADVEGPEIAAVAREIAGPPSGLGPARNESSRGPPDDAGPPDERGGNAAGPPEEREGNETGPPDDRGGNEAGPPGEPGRSEESNGGPPDDAGGGGNETTGSNGADGEPTPRGGQGKGQDQDRGQGQGQGDPSGPNDGSGDGNDRGAGDGNDGRGAGGNDDPGRSGDGGRGAGQ
jgi:hypothetical protein